jgi:muramidase (phage lysozyme)
LLSIDLKLTNLCSCGGFKPNNQQKPKEKNKYKWSHSEFGNLIAKKESSDNYNICNKTKGGLKVVNDVDVINTKISDIVKKQKNRDIFAVGRYQLIPATLNAAIESLGLDLSSNLNAEIQDQIFDEYLIKVKRPNIYNYLEKDGDVSDAMYDSAKEWASIGVEKGKRISDKIIKDKKGKIIERIKRYAKDGESYYAGDGLNKAHITPEQIQNALTNSKRINKFKKK